MPNFIIDKETCREIVKAGIEMPNEDFTDTNRGVAIPTIQPIIQVEIHVTGGMTSQNPTWKKEEGWDRRRWAYATVLDEDGFPTNRVIKVYSTMSVDKDWTNTDAPGGLNGTESDGGNSTVNSDTTDSGNKYRYACVLIHGHWHLLAPMMLSSATLRVAWNGLNSGGVNSTTGY